MTALTEIMEAMRDQVLTALGTADPLLEHLQVTTPLNRDPTPPSIDIYPADPFQEGIAFGKANNDLRFSVRARVTAADHEAGQNLLLMLMDSSHAASLTQAITGDRTLSNKISSLTVESISGFGIYQDAGGQGSLMGAVWAVRVFP